MKGSRPFRDGPATTAIHECEYAAAIADTAKELQAYIKAHVEFIEIGDRMLQQWEQGVALSLKAA